MKITNEKWSPHFLAVPWEVCTNETINPTDCLVYASVYFLQNLSEKKCFASNKLIGSLIGRSGRTVSASLKLEKINAIKRIMKINSGGKKERVEIKALVLVRAKPLQTNPGQDIDDLWAEII